jgi:hypothetical protein
MTATFLPKLKCFPAAQRLLWDKLDTVPMFVLYGGTALALHLGHRESIDFDFFGNCGFDPSRLRERIPFLSGGRIAQQEANTLTVVVDRGGPVKVSFFGLPGLRRINAPHFMATAI